jgi:hypothetical protein
MVEPVNIPADAVVVKSAERYELLQPAGDGRLLVVFSGGRLKKPVVAYVNAPPSKLTEALVDYVIRGLALGNSRISL